MNPSDERNSPDDLSMTVRHRRASMLDELQTAMRELHRRRALRRRFAAGSALLALVGILAVSITSDRDGMVERLPTPMVVEHSGVAPSESSALEPTSIRRVSTGDAELTMIANVTTEPTRRFIQPSVATTLIRRIDDEGLVTALTAVDRPAGLIRREGRDVELTHPVTDAQLGKMKPHGMASPTQRHG